MNQVLNDGSAVIINRGNTAALLISLEEYNSIRATEDLISTGTTPAEIENGIAAYQLVLEEFNLPKEKTSIKYAIHWDIGMSWR